MSYHAIGRDICAVAATVIVMAGTAGCSSSSTSSPDPSTTSSRPASTASSTSTSSAPPLPTVAPDRLDSLLLTGPEAQTVMGPDPLSPKTEVFRELDSNKTATPPECLGARWPAQKSVYEGSGYTAIVALELDPATKSEVYVQQSVATFPSQDAAQALVSKSAGAWKGCAGQNIATKNDTADPRRWTFGNVSGEPPKIAVLLTLEAGRGVACQHALSAVSNVVIDINACGLDVSDQGNQLADIIADKVAH
ncbi:MAG: serine/threonine kinase PknH [Mycobacterium sp.]|nr:serine/threonine kinase PknH [Mycobacterium sp.]